MIGLDGEKMSKSRGNLVLVSKLRSAGVDPMAIRLALLDGHYRSDREWTGGRLPAAEARLARWRAALAQLSGPPAAPVLAEVRARLADDLDTNGAIAAVDRWVDSAPPAVTTTRAPGVVRDTVDALLGNRAVGACAPASFRSPARTTRFASSAGLVPFCATTANCTTTSWMRTATSTPDTWAVRTIQACAVSVRSGSCLRMSVGPSTVTGADCRVPWVQPRPMSRMPSWASAPAVPE